MPKIKDKTELQIIEFLGENGPSFMGEVIKELQLSYTKGLMYFNSLLSKGAIKHSDPPLHYEINHDLK
ncbi:MAG TPA: hypothetical protein VKA10_07905 [Prolixibacteraceae bacterium]|nr:hypothetical protein [Prolixibacteraceae bacterium]